MRKLLIGITALILSSSLAAQDWQLVWADEFNSPVINPLVWKRIPRGNNDWNNYMSTADSLFRVENGILKLRGTVNTNPADTAPYLTGGLWTYGGMAFEPPFRVEIRAKVPCAQGAWPAIWMLPFDEKKYPYPSGGEIDIMEHINFDTLAYQTAHSYYTIVLNEKSNPPYSVTEPIDPYDFNTYALELYADSLVFYTNGRRTHVYPKIQTNLPEQFPFFVPMALLLDMQIGGAWVGRVEPSQLPVDFEVDYVRYYRPANERRIIRRPQFIPRNKPRRFS